MRGLIQETGKQRRELSRWLFGHAIRMHTMYAGHTVGVGKWWRCSCGAERARV
jgi:hypothetical protein